MMSPFLNDVAHLHQRTLVDAGRRVRALELAQAINVDARLGRIGFLGRANDDTGGVDLVDDARSACADRGAGVTRNDFFHARADERRFGTQKRHGLALHVRTHQRTVGVVVLEERNQGCSNRNKLFRRNVDELDLIRRRHHEVAALTAGHQFVDDAIAAVDRRVGLGDCVLRLFHRGEVHDLVGQVLVDHLTIRAFDEAVLVDARIGGERVDQTDIRAFRRFNRADAAVMRRMHVAHFETGAFARQAARSKGRHAALVGQFRQRVLLVHELRQLRRAEELAHCCGHRLCVDQVVRHDRVDVDRTHALLDRAFHAQQADAELVFHQLAHRAHAAIAEIVDVVDFAAAVAQFRECLEDRQDVFLTQDARRVGRIEAKTHVHLHAADAGKIVALAVKEQLAKQGFRRVERRRLAGAHDAVDVDERLLAAVVLVHRQRVAHIRACGDVVDVDDVDLVEARFVERGKVRRRQLVAGFDINLARFRIDHVERRVPADEFIFRERDLLHAIFLPLAQTAHRDLGTGFGKNFACLGVLPVGIHLGIAHPAGLDRSGPSSRPSDA